VRHSLRRQIYGTKFLSKHVSNSQGIIPNKQNKNLKDINAASTALENKTF
jgi:hypothetical protein